MLGLVSDPGGGGNSSGHATQAPPSRGTGSSQGGRLRVLSGEFDFSVDQQSSPSVVGSSVGSVGVEEGAESVTPEEQYSPRLAVSEVLLDAPHEDQSRPKVIP